MSHPAPLPSLPLSLLKPVFSPPHHSHHHPPPPPPSPLLKPIVSPQPLSSPLSPPPSALPPPLLPQPHYLNHHYLSVPVDATVSHLWTLLPFSLSKHPYPYTSNQSLNPVDSATYISVISSSSISSV